MENPYLLFHVDIDQSQLSLSLLSPFVSLRLQQQRHFCLGFHNQLLFLCFYYTHWPILGYLRQTFDQLALNGISYLVSPENPQNSQKNQFSIISKSLKIPEISFSPNIPEKMENPEKFPKILRKSMKIPENPQKSSKMTFEPVQCSTIQ